jgi:uncharacterized protein YdaU (DUF1376 family)
MAERPWMPMYWGDYLVDTLDLCPDEHGVYLLMIGIAWLRPDGALPNDMTLLKRMLAGCCRDMHGNRFNRIVPPLLKRFWTLGDDGLWRQKRVEKERENARIRSRNASERAKKRWQEHRDNKDLGDADAMLARPYHSHSHSKTQSLIPTSESLESDSEADRGSGGKVFVVAPDGAPTSQPNGHAKGSRGTRLSEDWDPGDDGVEYARELGFSNARIDEIYNAFRDYWLAKAGQAARKVSWPRTWKTWVRTEHERVREKEHRERSWREARRH